MMATRRMDAFRGREWAGFPRPGHGARMHTPKRSAVLTLTPAENYNIHRLVTFNRASPVQALQGKHNNTAPGNTRVIRHHDNGDRVMGIQLRGNSASWTGRKWFETCNFAAQQWLLDVLEPLGCRFPLNRSAGATVIILSYKRMTNISLIFRSALMCGFVRCVIVSNNNPDVDLGPHVVADT
jgi:hypothetical protein